MWETIGSGLITTAIALEELVRGRRWRFLPTWYAQAQQVVGTNGLVVAAELFSLLNQGTDSIGASTSSFMPRASD